MKFDYVIAGGGTCGLLLANRLSEDPNTTVAIIEPGGDVRNNPNVTVPTNFLVAFNTPIDWAYPTTPQPGAANRTMQMHSGKAIGGTSTINGMTYIRADAAEIDAWEALGNEGWNWTTLLPYYKKVEKFTRPTQAQGVAGASYEAAYHGEHGLLDVGFLYELPNGSFYQAARDTWQSLGYAVNEDVNSGHTRGFDVWPMTVDRDADMRWDAARAYYYAVEGRENLHLLHGTAVKLIWGYTKDGSTVEQATGVQYIDANNNTVTVDIEKEVILSAGALRTPLILEASGVGNSQVLRGLGVDTVIDLAGVGENFQDQANTNIIFTGTRNITGYVTYATFATADDIFGANKSAIAASTRANLTQYAEAMAAASNNGLNTTAIERVLRVQHDLMFIQNVSIAETITFSRQEYVATPYWCLLPFSRGSVHLGDVEETNSPVIDPRYFLIDFDMTQEVAIGKQAHAFFHKSPMSEYVSLNLTADPMSDEEWVEFTAASFVPNYHPVGTAAMMARELGGVVDKELRVYGTRNVRVVDASVLPMQVSGHLTSTLYAVAERASEIIKASSGQKADSYYSQ